MNEEERKVHILDIVEAYLDDDPVQWREVLSGIWSNEPRINFSFSNLCQHSERYRRKPEPETHSITRWECVVECSLGGYHRGESVYRTANEESYLPNTSWEAKETFTHTVGESHEGD